jgi:hypothetical protein
MTSFVIMKKYPVQPNINLPSNCVVADNAACYSFQPNSSVSDPKIGVWKMHVLQ